VAAVAAAVAVPPHHPTTVFTPAAPGGALMPASLYASTATYQQARPPGNVRHNPLSMEGLGPFHLLNPSLMSLAILTCYFGNLPWYFPYFLHSCSYNPTVDFYIITNDPSHDGRQPANVHFIYRSLPQIQALASEKLGFPVGMNNAYKICDLKPAFGFIFHEILAPYDFWGHGDLDIIYGNIRNFITDELMRDYDLISVRADWLTGCFLLFRNCDRMNRLFMKSKDYRRVFTDPRHFCFDETNFQHDAFTEGKSYRDVASEIESMMHVVQRLEEEGEIKTYFEQYIIEGRPGRLAWDKGTLTYKNEYEALLYHLIKLKEVYRPARPPHRIQEKFFISPTRIYS
jgi:hypothetical protein